MAGKESDLNYYPQESEAGQKPVEGQVIPHSRLLGEIFDQKQIPVPSNRETEIVNAVEEAVSSLTGREQVVLRLIFGLNGEPYSMAETGRNLGKDYNPVSRERIRQIKAKALRKLRHPSISNKTVGCLTIPTDCMARRVFGAVFEKDIPLIDFRDMFLAESTRDELAENDLPVPAGYLWRYSQRRYSPDNILIADLSGHSLSQEAYDEITGELKRLAREEKGKASKERAQTSDMRKPEEQEKKVANKLIPEIPLSEEELKEMRGRSIEELDLSAKAYWALRKQGIKNIDQLFEMERKDILGIRNIGAKIMLHLGERLEKFLDLPEERYEKGVITGLFAPLITIVRSKSESELAQTRDEASKEIDENVSMQNIRLMVKSAFQEGCIFPEEVQAWMKKNEKSVGFDPNGDMTLALIEYTIAHPQKKKER